MSHTPQVVNCKKAELQKKGYRDLVHWLEDPNHVYIGRDMTRYVPGAVGSKWGNPFTQRHGDLETRIRDYEGYIRQQGYDFMELSGKSLGCWCHPGPCHGDILMRLVREAEKANGLAPPPSPPAPAPAPMPAAAGTPPPAKNKNKNKKKSRLQ